MKHLLIIISLLLLVACNTSKPVISEPVVLNNTDSVRDTTIIKTIYVPVTVEVDVPQQSHSTIATDTSHLETDVALSDAWINADGTLYHSIANKRISLSANTFVAQTTTEHTAEAIQIKEIAVPQPYTVEIERKFTLMEQIKLSSWWLLLAITFFCITYIFRNPLFKLLRKVV